MQTALPVTTPGAADASAHNSGAVTDHRDQVTNRRDDAVRRKPAAARIDDRDKITPARPGNDHDADLAMLHDAVGRVTGRNVASMGQAPLDAELRQLESAVRRLTARQARVTDAIARHRARAMRDARPQHPNAGEHARRDLQGELADDMNWTPSQAKEMTQTSRRLRHMPRASEAFDAGDITTRHVDLLASTLRCFADDDRDEAEAQLVEAATRQDPATFGRTCRRLLAERDHEAATREENRRHDRRSTKMVRTPDGTLRMSGELSGVDAETVMTAIHAFRRPDPAGTPDEERRRAEQITADAFVEVCRVALRAGEAPSTHGVRPHVVVTIDLETLAKQHGAAHLANVGSVPFSEVRRLLADADVARILTDATSLPLEAGEAVRTVPAGLWRSLVHRDGGCIARGCDAPAPWTDVMHLETAFAELGRLSPDNAALGCRMHHRAFDRGEWQVAWTDGRPRLQPSKRRRADSDRPPADDDSPSAASSPPADTRQHARCEPGPAAAADRSRGRDPARAP